MATLHVILSERLERGKYAHRNAEITPMSAQLRRTYLQCTRAIRKAIEFAFSMQARRALARAMMLRFWPERR